MKHNYVMAVAADGLRAVKAIHKEVMTLQFWIVCAERTVYVSGSKVELKPMEYALMLMFMKHPNIVFTREQLLHEVWGDEYHHVDYD